MKLYAASLAVGVLVGVIYGLLHVRSPAPPVIALIGLAGILLGEQRVPAARKWVAHAPAGIVQAGRAAPARDPARPPASAGSGEPSY